MNRAILVTQSMSLAVTLVCLSFTRADEDNSWGTVKGQIVWGGHKLPAREREVVDKDKEHCLEKGSIISEKWVIHPENKGVRWVFVWLTPDSDE